MTTFLRSGIINKQEPKILALEDLAWAAGFFEGEGHINVQERRNKSFICITVAQVDRRPLDKLQSLFGGKVYGPYGPYTTQKRPYYQYQAYTNFAVDAINQMLPYLFHKGEQAQAALNKWKEYCDNRA